MRLITAAAAAVLLALPASAGFAQTTAPAGGAAPVAPTPVPSPAAPASPQASPVPDTPPAPAASAAAGSKRMTLQQRFEAANTAKDGHLTRAESDGAKWSYVSRHFDAIDKTHKGYVTVADIHAYSKASHAARKKHGSTTAAPSGAAGATPDPASPARSPAPPQ